MQLAGKQRTIPSESIWVTGRINHIPGCLQSVNKHPNPEEFFLSHTQAHTHRYTHTWMCTDTIRGIPRSWAMWKISTQPLSGTVASVSDPAFCALLLFSKTCICTPEVQVLPVSSPMLVPPLESRSLAKAEVPRVGGVFLCVFVCVLLLAVSNWGLIYPPRFFPSLINLSASFKCLFRPISSLLQESHHSSLATL